MGNGLQQFYYIEHICNDHGRRTKDTAKQHSTVNQEKKKPNWVLTYLGRDKWTIVMALPQRIWSQKT